MRPLRLEVSGLTCFREKTVVDFSAMSVLAIEGPTGAGKSSLLDAMILALYGSVPRMGKQGLSELVSHGRSGLSVVFDFQIGGGQIGGGGGAASRWRVSRTVQRGGRPAQAILAQLIEGDDGEVVEKRLFDGVQKVLEEVKRLLGIDVDAFQQAVILPQGEFQKFLKTTPKERREVLSALLGLGFYEAMRDKANKLGTALEAEVGQLDRQLAGDFEGATAEAVEALGAELEVARVVLGAAQADEARAREAAARIERVAAQCEELARLDAELVRMGAQAEMMAEEDRRVGAARRVMGAVPLIAGEEAARAREVRDAGRVEAARARVEAARARVEVARVEAARAADEAREIDNARQRLGVLDEARVRIEQRDGLKREVQGLRAELGRALQTREAAGQAVAAAEVEVGAARGRLEAAREEAARAATRAVAVEVLERWQAARVVAARVAAARVELAREVEAAGGAGAAVDKAEQALDASEVEQRKAELREAQASELRGAAEAALRAAEHEARVALVRAHLHVGEACPVCKNTVTRVPESVGGAGGVEARRAEVEARNTALEAARRASERARQDAAVKRSAWEAARARLEEVRAAVARREEAIRADEGVLVGVMGAAGAGAGSADDGGAGTGGAAAHVAGAGDAGGGDTRERVEVRFGVRLAQMEALAREAAERARTADGLALELERALAVWELKRGAAAAAAERCSALEARVGEVGARLDGEDARVAALNVTDPGAEKAALEARIAQLDAAVRAAQAELQRREVEAATAEAEARAAGAAWEEAKAAWGAAEVALMAELGRLVMTIDEVRRAALSGEEIETRARAVASFRAERAAREARRVEVAKMVADGLGELGRAEPVGARAVAEARDLVAERARAARAAGERVGVLGERLEQAKDKLGRADSVRAERVDKAARRDVYKRLAEDLRSNNFQEYVLGEVVADLLRGASERLFALSGGRYRLGSGEQGGLVVVDLEHLGETRSADTLSGGETFLASLALALELSEQIQARTGPVHLDCLFVDEGFGSLDAETLETVADAIEQLGRTGRLVGIITHVAELARRMPDRLVVAKSAAGSTVQVAS